MTKKTDKPKSKSKTTPKPKRIFKSPYKPEFNQHIEMAYALCSFISCFVCKQYSYFTLFDLDKLGYEIPYEVLYHPNSTSPTFFQYLKDFFTQELEKKLLADGWMFIRPGCGEKYEPICPKCDLTFLPIEDPVLLARLERLTNGEDILLDGESLLDPEGLVQ